MPRHFHLILHVSSQLMATVHDVLLPWRGELVGASACGLIEYLVSTSVDTTFSCIFCVLKNQKIALCIFC